MGENDLEQKNKIHDETNSAPKQQNNENNNRMTWVTEGRDKNACGNIPGEGGRLSPGGKTQRQSEKQN